MDEREYLVMRLREARADTLNRGPDHGRHWKVKWVNYKMAEKALQKFDEKAQASKRSNKEKDK